MNRSLENRIENHQPEPQTTENEPKSHEASKLEALEQAEGLVEDAERTIESILDELPSLPADKQAIRQQEVFRLSEKLKNYNKRLKNAENGYYVLYDMDNNQMKLIDRNIEKARINKDKVAETELLEERAALSAQLKVLAGVTIPEGQAAKVEQKVSDYKRTQTKADTLQPVNPDNQQTQLYETESHDPEEKKLMNDMFQLGLDRDNAGDNQALADQAESKRLALKKQLTELWAKEDENDDAEDLKKAA